MGSSPAGLRFAELYAGAVERLGDRSAQVRIGALYHLETLGHEHRKGRAAIVDVLATYLRTSDPARVDDAAARQIAQRILGAHLRPGGPGFWAGQRLDLTGALLVDLNLSGCRIDGDLLLDGAILRGPARLRRLAVSGRASLRHTVVHGNAWMEGSSFGGPLQADWASFQADAWFGNVTFAAGAAFVGTTFGGHAWFAGCSSRGLTDFGQALFRRSAGFRGADLETVGLAETTFLGPARVSRRGDAWNVNVPGWTVVTDPDNESVGQLLYVGDTRLIHQTPA